MKYYRYISETQIEPYEKGYVIVELEEVKEVDGEQRVIKRKVQISYPSAETLLKVGIKPLVVEEMPLYNEETQYVDYYYVDGEVEITQKWNVYDIPEEVIDDEITDA